MAETQEELMAALEAVRYVTLHLEEPRRTAITKALMDMEPAVRCDALQKLRDGVKGEYAGVGLHEELPPIALPERGEEEFEAAAAFDGPRVGCVYKSSDQGLGYYRDIGPLSVPPPLVAASSPEASAPAPAVGEVSDTPCAELKSAGNALFKAKRWKDASKQYTLAVERADAGAEQPEPSLLVSCLLNRAACFLKMQRYGSAAKDCGCVIELDPKSVKAWYRRGEAHYNMKQVEKARDDLAMALQLNPSDEQIRRLYEKAKKAAGDEGSSAYWMENFDFASGTFKTKGVAEMSLGEQLFRAASDGNLDGVRKLGGMPGCDVNTRVNGYTPLMSAASKGLAAAVEVLVKDVAGVEVMARTDDGDSSLHLAARDGHAEVVQVLCASRAREDLSAVNDRGIDALMVAAFAGQLSVVQLLLTKPEVFDPAKTDTEGLTALHQAAAAGEPNIVLEFVALPSASKLVGLKTANGQTCLHKAAMGTTPGHVECVRILAGPESCQVHPMQPDNDSLNVVLLAAAHGSLPVIRLLSDRPDCDMADTSGSGQNAVHMAAMMGHLPILHFLLHELNPPVDPNTADNRGWTPLHFGASQAREAIVHYLVGISKVDVFAADMEGQMPADVAQAGGFDKVESWLRDRMGAQARPKVIGLTLDATGEDKVGHR